MKKCIWCQLDEKETTFNRLAHTVPQTLGGQKICINVCDICNSFFGNHFNKLPSVETVIKETFNISRIRFLDTQKQIGKNKIVTKFSSIYFNVDLKKHKIDLKPSYRHQSGFQEKIGRQLKKGLYKMFLEESERQYGNGHEAAFDFIREFSRNDIGNYPVFYFERSLGAIAMHEDWVEHPELLLAEDSQFKYLVREPGFVEFEFLGHVLGLATSRNWEEHIKNYIEKSSAAKKDFFHRWRFVDRFSDIDLALSILDDKPSP